MLLDFFAVRGLFNIDLGVCELGPAKNKSGNIEFRHYIRNRRVQSVFYGLFLMYTIRSLVEGRHAAIPKTYTDNI